MDLNLLWAAMAAVLPAAVTDLVFSDLAVRKRYQQDPETWRAGDARPRMAAAVLLTLPTSLAFVMLAWKTHQTDFQGAMKLAAMIWLIGPLPLLIGNSLLIRMDHGIAASQACGWLAKLLAIAAVTAWFVD
jgi:hypothetical protein